MNETMSTNETRTSKPAPMAGGYLIGYVSTDGLTHSISSPARLMSREDAMICTAAQKIQYPNIKFVLIAAHVTENGGAQ